MDLLVIETYTLTPHLETAGEIAICSAEAGQKTGFSFIYVEEPNAHAYMAKTPIRKVLGASPKAKVYQLQSKLKPYGVVILPVPSLSETINQEIQSYVQNAPRNLDALKKYQYKQADLGLATVSSLISSARTMAPDPDENRALIQQYLLCAAIIYEKAKVLIFQCQPKKIISFNGRFAFAKPIFEAAKHLGVSAEYHERGATYDRYEIYEKPPHDYAYVRQQIIKSWQQAEATHKVEKAHAFFTRRRKGEGIGWVSFTDHQNKDLVPLREDSIRQIVYYSSSDDEFAATSDSSTQPIFKIQRKAIQFLMDWVATQENCQLTVRVHPHLNKKSESDRIWWNTLKGPNVTVIPSDSQIDSYALMNWANVVVTYGSTAGIEATYWGASSILLGDSFYSGLNCVYEPQSREAAVKLLKIPNLPPLPQENCLPYGFHYLCHGKKYRHYTPESLFSGKFLGEYLTEGSRLYKALRALFRRGVK